MTSEKSLYPTSGFPIPTPTNAINMLLPHQPSLKVCHLYATSFPSYIGNYFMQLLEFLPSLPDTSFPKPLLACCLTDCAPYPKSVKYSNLCCNETVAPSWIIVLLHYTPTSSQSPSHPLSTLALTNWNCSSTQSLSCSLSAFLSCPTHSTAHHDCQNKICMKTLDSCLLWSYSENRWLCLEYMCM